MTVITRLHLKNFKSFKKAEIPFSEGFTAVAGPNGSGKSNILDGLLFAMGITSLKQLRAARLTELVNHDAKEGYAKVELGVKGADGKEIVVSRLIDRQGKSIYKLDDKRKTLNEIQSLLLEIGINPNGHNIVVQGDITRIIEMNAKQRRQIIDEAAGLQEFEEKKDEALKKLEQVDRKVKDAMLILKEREEYLRQIELDRENALKAIALQEESKRSKSTILSEEIKILSKEIEIAKSSIGALAKEVEDKRSERNRLQDEERELEKKVDEATKNLIDASEKTYSSLGKEVEQKKGHLNLVAERLSAKRGEIEGKKIRKEHLLGSIVQAQKEIDAKSAELASAKEKLAQTSEKLEKAKKALEVQGPKFEKKAGEEKAKDQRLTEVIDEISGLKDKLHELQIARHMAQNETKSAQHLLSEAENSNKKLLERLARKKEISAKVREFEKKNPAEKLAKKHLEIEQIASEIHSMHGRVGSINESIETLSKTKAHCPICEKPLEAAHREQIHRKKNSEVSAANSRIKELQSARSAALEEKAALEIEVRQHTDLLASLTGFEGIEGEIESLVKRMEGYKHAIDSEKTLKGAEEEKRILADLKSIESERIDLEKEIEAAHASTEAVEMNTLLLDLNSLNTESNERQNTITKLSIEIEQALLPKIAAWNLEIASLENGAIEAEKFLQQMELERENTEKDLGKMEAELEKANKANRLLEEEKNRLTEKIDKISEKRETLAQKIEAREKEMNETNIEMSKNEVRVVDLQEEFKDYANVEPFDKFILNELKKRLPQIEKEIEQLGAINMKSLENFDSFKKEVDDVRSKANKLDEERQAVLEMIQKIDVKKMSVFMECFNHVSTKFSELYFKFFNGQGMLDLTDKINPVDGGLLIQAKYKEDTLKSIDAMSGGEKSLTALAFIFAIQSFHPAPFYILDEVDAALDKDNSIKIGQMIKEMCEGSQFISISHNDSVINQADQIIGVALNKQKSSVVGLKLRKGSKYEAPKDEPSAQKEAEEIEEEGEAAPHEEGLQ